MSDARTSTRGFAFPFRIDDATGGVKAESGDDKLRANIIHILLTNAGERVMRRGYGGGLRRLVQAPNNDALWAVVQHQIGKTVSLLEPRVLLQEVSLTRSDDGATLFVSMTYMIRRTRAVEKLRVPIDIGSY